MTKHMYTTLTLDNVTIVNPVVTHNTPGPCEVLILLHYKQY